MILHRKQTQGLFELKSQIIATNETLETKKNLLEEMTAERRRLVKEKKMMMDMIQAIQRDIETVCIQTSNVTRQL
jgi:hypothetical protein